MMQIRLVLADDHFVSDRVDDVGAADPAANRVGQTDLDLFAAVDHAEAEAPVLIRIVAVPEGQGVAGQLRQTRARDHGGRLGRLDPTVLIGIAAGDAPALGEAAGDAEFHALGALAVDQQRFGRVGRIGDHHVAAVEAVGRGREGQVGTDVPFQAELVIFEIFGIERPVGERE